MQKCVTPEEDADIMKIDTGVGGVHQGSRALALQVEGKDITR